jgi:hypothetical protein
VKGTGHGNYEILENTLAMGGSACSVLRDCYWCASSIMGLGKTSPDWGYCSPVADNDGSRDSKRRRVFFEKEKVRI